MHSKKRIKKIIDIVDNTPINALVIDVKSEYGGLQYISHVPLAKKTGASWEKVVKNLKSVVKIFKEKGIYLIARQVVFKDDILAKAEVNLAIKKDGKPWESEDKLSWTDPYSKEVRQYNIEIAKEIADLGFDEIQFDYVRFPGVLGLETEKINIEENRVTAINAFLKDAYNALLPKGVVVSVDIFGYVCMNDNDTGIGQKLKDISQYVDIVSPMLYPSGYGKTFPNMNIIPVAEPKLTIYHSLSFAEYKDKINPLKFRPWLQAFQDYSYDYRKFSKDQIKAQIAGAEEFGSSGWMLWHPSSRYNKEHID